MSDTEFLNDSDQDVSESHSKLIEAVSQLDKGQKIKKPERSEPTLEVSEFHLVKSGITDKDAINIQDLAKSLGRKGHHVDITRKLETVQKKVKVLRKPLEKPVAERIKRTVGFENTKKDLQKWNAVISSNRTAEHITFPLPRLALKSEQNTKRSDEFLKRFRLQSNLEKELEKLEPKKEEPEKTEDKFALTLEEIMEKRKEFARFRAQQSYKEAKANRQKKIKSKKFHRIQRREKTKQELKEFEELQKTDPEAALKKLELLDLNRIKERMSLRHKNTGQWAKNKLIKAKYDKDTRQELAQQLSISRELTQKVRAAEDSNSDDDDLDTETQFLSSNNRDDDNPWLKPLKTDSEIDGFIDSYRKYWDNKQAEQNKNGTVVGDTSKKSHVDRVLPNPVTKVIIENIENGEQNGVENQSNLDQLESHSNQESASKIMTSGQEVNELPKSNEEEIVTNGTLCVKPTNPKKAVNSKIQKKKARKTVSTSAWVVQPIESTNEIQSNVESINNIFDEMEETIENNIKSKLQGIKRKYNMDSTRAPNKNSEINCTNKDYDDDYKGLRLDNKKQKPIIDEPVIENLNEEQLDQSKELENLKELINAAKSTLLTNVNNTAEIDPNKYINVKPKYIKSQLPDVSTGGTEALDDSESENDEKQFNLISEAFADDNVVEEFRKEKKNAIKSSKPENIDLTLPGWGTWGGRNIRTSRRKKKRFIIKVPKDAPRRDDNKGNVIIYEDKEKIRDHQVNDLPYPFESVKDFEASIRAPLGRNFVPENAHNQLIKPVVERKMGQIIEPMDESVLVDTKKLMKNKQLEKNKKMEARVKPKMKTSKMPTTMKKNYKKAAKAVDKQ